MNNTKTYTFIRDGVPEEVAVERWGWVAGLLDGTEIKQFADDGTFHQMGEIADKELAFFALYKMDDPTRKVIVHMTPETKPVHRYKRYVFNFGGEVKHSTIYVFGWCKGSQHFLNFIMPDDAIIQSNDVFLKIE